MRDANTENRITPSAVALFVRERVLSHNSVTVFGWSGPPMASLSDGGHAELIIAAASKYAWPYQLPVAGGHWCHATSHCLVVHLQRLVVHLQTQRNASPWPHVHVLRCPRTRSNRTGQPHPPITLVPHMQSTPIAAECLCSKAAYHMSAVRR